MNSELEVLFDVVARLEDAGIDYMLTGSVAMSGADEAYLCAWSEKLGVEALLRKCMDEGYDP
jgi:hypothetical protein